MVWSPKSLKRGQPRVVSSSDGFSWRFVSLAAVFPGWTKILEERTNSTLSSLHAFCYELEKQNSSPWLAWISQQARWVACGYSVSWKSRVISLITRVAKACAALKAQISGSDKSFACFTSGRVPEMATCFQRAVFIAFVVALQDCHSKQCLKGPPLPNRPFITVWNTPTDKCKDKWNVSLDLDAFDFVVNRNQTWCGEYIVIFYNDQLGLYPFFDSDGKAVNGGLPQVHSYSPLK